MQIVELLRHLLTEKEKSVSDAANGLLDTFVRSQNLSDFRYVRFHSEPSNDPNGYRVIYIENMGYTLVNGDGDKGFGWTVDGVKIYEYVNNCFRMSMPYFQAKEDVKHYDREEIAFINDFEEFLDYLFDEVFYKKFPFTSSDVFNNQAVKNFIDLNMDIRYVQRNVENE